MSAITDKFTYVGQPGTVTSLQSPGKALAASSINIGSATNWPTTSAVYFAIRKVDPTLVSSTNLSGQVPGSYTEWKGTLSGTAIGNLALQYGTDQVYTAGTNTQVFIPIVAARENSLVDGILTQHNQDGTHSAVTATSVTTTAAITAGNGLTVSTGTVAVPNNTAFIVPANLTAGAGTSWTPQSYTPVWTNSGTANTIGNGTLTGSSVQVGKLVYYRVSFTVGTTTSAGNGSWIFSLPVATVGSTYAVYSRIGDATAFISGASYAGLVRWNTTTTVIPVMLNAAGTYAGYSDVNSAAGIPAAYGPGAVIELSGWYIAA